MIMNPLDDSDSMAPARPTGVSRADLHIHSKYSNRPSEWFLRRIGAPESFVEPRAVYDACKAAGMDYVTIADHNCIDGALEIADLPGTFISTELTTYFPEDRCKIHCLVCGISSKQFAELQEIRADIYDLRRYLLENQIFHTITHPLFRVNDKLTPEHVEKLILLFNCFEGINGARDNFSARVAAALFSGLTPGKIARLADRHGIAPTGETPWVKSFTGGSDDHGGLYSASAYTVTPAAPTVYDFLENLRHGAHKAGGNSGCSLQLADSLLRIGSDYYRSRLSQAGGAGILGRLIERLAGRDAPPSDGGRLKAMTRKLVTPIVRRRKYKQLSDLERELIDEFSKLAKEGWFKDSAARAPGGYQERYDAAARLGHHVAYAFLTRFSQQLSQGSLIGGLQSLASLVPVGIGMTPYLAAFSTQHKDDRFLRQVADHFGCCGAVSSGTTRKAWLTDTYDDVNGVAKTIRTLAALANESNMPITVVTSLEHDPVAPYPVKNFKPVGMFELPDYPQQKFAFPPFMEILAWLENGEFDELLISTPGPVGLLGILAAKLLGIPARGIYHTDFPQYIGNWTDDQAMVELTKRFMRWFYGQMEVIYAPTSAYVDELEKLGFEREIIRVLPRGVNTDTFSPAHRRNGYWNRYNLNGGFKFIYVGRVSHEKNIRALMQAYRKVRQTGLKADLAIVGDGPELAELRRDFAGDGVAFTGYLHGDELASAYASSDALVFPSLTDTFGNVVLEAHASGLPAIVSDQGGPQEIVRANNSGLIVDATKPDLLAKAMADLATGREQYSILQKRAMKTARASSWHDVLVRL